MEVEMKDETMDIKKDKAYANVEEDRKKRQRLT